MLFQSLILLLALCLAVSLVDASPIYSLKERQDTCGNTAAIFQSECWTSEQIAFYLSDPTEGNHISSIFFYAAVDIESLY